MSYYKQDFFHSLSNINILFQKTLNKYGPYSFEITEIECSNKLSNEQPEVIQHIFVAENQKVFDEWYSILENIIVEPSSLLKQPAHHSDHLSSPISFSASVSSLKSSEVEGDKLKSPSTMNGLQQSSSLNESGESNEIKPKQSLENNLDTGKLFDLNKVDN